MKSAEDLSRDLLLILLTVLAVLVIGCITLCFGLAWACTFLRKEPKTETYITEILCKPGYTERYPCES
jgi:hypothetical protein